MIPKETPAKKPFVDLPSALDAAVKKEWEGQQKFVARKMPLTSLAFTAIDRIEPQKEAIVEALLVYIDTDTLCYRSMDSKQLEGKQKEKWDPVLAWSSVFLSGKKPVIAKWQTTSGIMPLAQPPELVEAFGKYLASKNAFELAAISILAGGYSSLILALAVAEKHISGEKGYELSRLEEKHSEDQWGRDEEAHRRNARIAAEMLAAARFLKLLDAA
jgi:chaperone required for assembly of F1-ATPase